MRNHRSPLPYCILERSQATPGSWSLRCLIGAELRDRREFRPHQDSEAVHTRAAGAGEAWRLANGGDPAGGPSPIDGWVTQLEQNMRDLQHDPDRLYELTKRGF